MSENTFNEQAMEVSEEALEFDQIRQAIAELCQTEIGHFQTLSQRPFSDLVALKEYFSHLSLLDEQGWKSPPSLSDVLPSLGEVFSQVQKRGSTLSLIFLAKVVQFIDYYAQLRLSLIEVAIDAELFLPSMRWEMLGRLSDLVSVQGELQEQMDPPLMRILAAISLLQNESMNCAQRIMQDHSEWFTSDLPVLRNDRITLPLSVKYRSQISGVLLAVSETGLTLFIEPTELLYLNNQLIAKKTERERRIREILNELTDLVRSHAKVLHFAENKLGTFDLLAAKLQWGHQHNAKIIIPDKNQLVLTRAIHPLFAKKFSPLEINITSEKTILVLSGPNAGGKTVLLKTVGLLTLMAHYGMPITADAESQLPFFHYIHCVLGDSQSLSQSLSSFSGRLTQIAAIFPMADQSLVLLDELGNDTDPQEGSALSCAFLDAFLQRGSWVIVTTHLHLVKVYAMRNERMHCAAMGFDEQAHTPDYHLIMDHLGLSHAFESAERCGIPPDILSSARRYSDANDSQSLVKNFSELLEEYQRKFSTLEELNTELRDDRDVLEEKKRELANMKKDLVKNRRQFLREFRQDASRKLDALIRELREEGMTEKMRERVQEFRQELNQQVEATEGNPSQSGEFCVGQWVRWRGGKSQGQIKEVGSNGIVYVLFGGKRVRVRSEMLEHGEAKNQDPVSFAPSYTVPSHSAHVSLDLRGERLAEAENRTDRHLQQAVMAGLQRVEIIHGIGEGILRKGIREFLSMHTLAMRWENAGMQEGGAGKTIVYLVQ